jgi:hypothetical protein
MGSLLLLQLVEEGADDERLDALTGFLRQELLQLNVDDVSVLPVGEPPPGARGWDAAAIGGLLVTVGSAAHGLGDVISATRAWLMRGDRSHRAVRLEMDGDTLELSDATATDQERLIGLFIDRHAGSSGSGRSA